ncbi:hypothetical protein M3Y94_00113800 [Aphelenchoides besseyi]|nr:hypothetical protein M3Y94_00113800 [Aphelenchoides besseyi]KAI6237475.1 hypothetical protein M3Y95_00269100 [Aphelenchoides besseyi]
MKSFLFLFLSLHLVHTLDPQFLSNKIEQTTTTESTGFVCYDGESTSKQLLKQEECKNGNWCIKLVDKDNFYVLRACDPNHVCSSFGDTCSKTTPELGDMNPSWNSDLFCCCGTPLCNSANSPLTRMCLLILLILFIV